MIDVGQGDSILISAPNNKFNILIDSYGYNINYLKDKGIKKIDLLFITHSDSDHINSLSSVLDNLKVVNVYTNQYDTLGYNEKFTTSGSIFNNHNIHIEVLGPLKDYENKNDNSLVLMIKIEGYKFLLMGDNEMLSEMDLIRIYGNKLKADVLKVGHHGSSTSSSKEFISLVSPNYSIISSGLNNKFNFPSTKVLANLKNSTIYNTAYNGNITCKIYNQKLSISSRW